MRQYTVSDLLSAASLERFNHMVASHAVQISDKDLAQMNLSRQNISAISPSFMAPKEVKMRKVLAHEFGPESRQRKKDYEISTILQNNHDNLKLCLKIFHLNLKILRDRARALAKRRKKIAQLRAAIKKLKGYEWAVRLTEGDKFYLEEKIKMDKILEELKLGELAEKEDITQVLSDIIDTQHNLDTTLVVMKEQKMTALDQFSQVYASKLQKYISPKGYELFKDMSDKARHAFLREFFHQDRKLKRIIDKEIRSQAAINRQLDKLHEQRRNLMYKMVMDELKEKIAKNPLEDKLRPERITNMHQMERDGLKNEKIVELDKKIKGLGVELQESKDRVIKAKEEKKLLLTNIAKKHHIEPLAQAGEAEQNHFLSFCSEEQKMIYEEMDKWADIRVDHKKQQKELEEYKKELQAQYPEMELPKTPLQIRPELKG